MSNIAVITAPQAFIATTPAQMEEAQKGMIAWCEQRTEAEKLEVADLERTIAEAQNAGLNVGAWKKRLAMSRAKMTFYRKVKLALMAGYYIIPPLDVQRFAIRSDKWAPRGYEKSYRTDFEQNAGTLKEGVGEWRSNFPEIHSRKEQSVDSKGNAVTNRYYWPENWQIPDFPFKLVRPEVIAAVGKAFNEKIFDALGVLPKYRNPDPIVVGQIIPPHRRNEPLTFFVAWWMDPKDL